MSRTAEAGPGVVWAGPLSNESALIGTPAYMAPEQLKGAAANARSDLFAFGAMLYEMIGGRRAFDGGSQTELVTAILDHEPPPLSTPAGSVPQTVSASWPLPRQGPRRTLADRHGYAARAALGTGRQQRAGGGRAPMRAACRAAASWPRPC